MSNHIIKQALVIVALVLLSFFVLPNVAPDLPANIAMSLGIVLGGLVAIFIVPTSLTDESDDSESPSYEDDGSTKTIYVGNLPYRANEAAVRELFSNHGDVKTVRLMRDRNTGKRKGFGFVEMDESGADKAIEALNDSDFQQRTLKVREAKDRSNKEES
ncbi:RNA recognition motif domain-containing protein [Catenovulum sediminis]|uniref:RNA recognition motif domain-containing protein n=1 Tax=Catenovulum sediminis TaxID=1740262 RepID=UPI00117C82AC|nr:RNA-binding protein [Catenovulum sediminis]